MIYQLNGIRTYVIRVYTDELIVELRMDTKSRGVKGICNRRFTQDEQRHFDIGKLCLKAL
ncbi:MAG: hypothetical protein IPI22_01835 [Bacteroidetes bacterium]|nr:hypothetical protein [Bacteroidota bacterium]